ncbi:Glycerol-3-phosphate acyltransferase 2, mitochondrial [Collichthys lucidus]|uniref:Glycerol-3-phosphate acyltransferase 2, mitochondrial n=1 Tax=Collichthys lucidus TaxID=240159 RepID=A0A4U5UX46_COLLU|nr:Glycerol-3-phosphate acyltransferase 2, mitochondrial [Collichthys lucidus]
MVHEKNDGINKEMAVPPFPQNRPALSWELKIKKTLRLVPPCLGKLRPIVGQCCHQCTPDSLSCQSKKTGQNVFLGFQDLLKVNETHTRYRGWLVRRVCCVLFVSGCKVYARPANNRLDRVCQSNRVKEALTAEHNAPEGGDSRGQINRLSSFLPLINTCIIPSLLRFVGWVVLKMFASIFNSIQVNLNHLPALRRASQEGSLLVYVYVRQSIMDCALIPLVLLCHNLRVPYTVSPLQINSYSLRSILQKVGVILLPPSAVTEQDAELDSLYSTVMTSLVHELLHEGQALSVGVSAESGRGGQWLARIRQLIKEGSVPDVSLVPVGISYDCVPKTKNIQVGLSSLLRLLWSLFWRRPRGGVRIDFAQPFSLKEMCESGRCRVDEWLPLQDLLLPVILDNRAGSVFGWRRMSWLLPSSHCASELKEPTPPERDLSIAIILHLIYSATSCMAVMSTSLVSSLLLYRRRKGTSTSLLCRDVAWLTEEVFFRNKDVGFGGSLAEVIHYSLSLLAPHVIIAAVPSSKDPFIVPRPSLAATLHLTVQAQIVTHTFILEAVGACAVSAMLCEVASSGVSTMVRSSGVDGKEPCQSSRSFALDAVDSLVHCGILIMEEIPREVPKCDVWKKDALTWTTSDDPYNSDSDCEEQDLHSYKISQSSQCPEMLFFLCSMLSGHLRTLCWATTKLDLLHTPLLGMCTVLLEERQKEGVFLDVSSLFQLSENRKKLHRFISHYLYN